MVGNWMLSSGIDRESIILVVGGKDLGNESLEPMQTSYADVLVLRGSNDNATVAKIVDAMTGLQKRERCLAWEVEQWSTAHRIAAIEHARVAIKQGPICDVVQKCLEPDDDMYLTGERVSVFTTDGCTSDFLCGEGGKESALSETCEENLSRRARAVVLARSKDLAPAQVALANVLSQHFSSSAEINTTDLETFAKGVSGIRVELALLSPNELLKKLPLTAKAALTVHKARDEIGRILDRKDDRLIVISGPCSIHDPRAALEYAEKLKKFADEHKEELVVVMRTYFEKPRTTVGWKGLLTDPDLDGTCDLNKGLQLCRGVLMRINELGLPCAVEMLSNIAPPYFFDLVSWAAVGARTTESQIHREMVSGMDRLPVGFKNGTQGNTDIAVDAIECAGASHSYLTVGADGRACIAVSGGNKQCHVILRGGKQGPNFSAHHVTECDESMRKKNLRKRLIVDCSHGNSNKNHANQPKVIADIANQVTCGSQTIGGVMIESNLVEGAQKLDPGKTNLKNLTYGQSVTDACVNLEVTNDMFVTLANGVKRRRLH